LLLQRLANRGDEIGVGDDDDRRTRRRLVDRLAGASVLESRSRAVTLAALCCRHPPADAPGRR
jgi:hypothetical protein